MKVYEIFTEIHIFEKLMILLKLFLKYNDKKKKKERKNGGKCVPYVLGKMKNHC